MCIRDSSASWRNTVTGRFTIGRPPCRITLPLRLATRALPGGDAAVGGDPEGAVATAMTLAGGRRVDPSAGVALLGLAAA